MKFFRDRTIAPRDKAQAPPLALRIGSLQHIGARENQQDSFGTSDLSDHELCLERGFLAVVTDGMGGLKGGATFSSQAVNIFLHHFTASDLQLRGLTPGSPAEVLMGLLAEANAHILRVKDDCDFPSGGSTLVSVVISGTSLYFISVGDSRIYLLRGGALIQLSREHVYSVELDDQAIRGELTFDAARADSQRRALTSYLGMERLALIDRNVRPVRLLPKDYVLLMTDGVFGTLAEDEIAATVFGSAAESAGRLERAVLDKGKSNQDNFTAIIIGCA